MSWRDKMNNSSQRWRGKAKEMRGRMGGERDTERRGRGQQAGADFKDAGEKAKDTARKIRKAGDR